MLFAQIRVLLIAEVYDVIAQTEYPPRFLYR